MNLTLKGLPQLIQDMSAALQQSASALIDVSVGSVVRALFEANASVVLWLQWLVLCVLQTTRAATSTGNDLDTWVADFGLMRLPACAATGDVTFSRFVPTLTVSIPVGSTVKTNDGVLSFSVIEDDSISTWQHDIRAYVMPGGVAAINVPVQCLTPGISGNVLANSITVISASLPGIDLVNNQAAFTNGVDAEGDSALRSRFQGFMSSRPKATLAAVRNAVAGVRQGLAVSILENTRGDGLPEIGNFTIIVDDGSGSPSSDLLSAVASAVDTVRPIGSTFSISRPNVLTVNVSVRIDLGSRQSVTSIIDAVQASVTDYLNFLPISGTASVTRVAQHVYLASGNIVNVTDIQLNGSTSDIVPTSFSVLKAGQVTVAINGG